MNFSRKWNTDVGWYNKRRHTDKVCATLQLCPVLRALCVKVDQTMADAPRFKAFWKRLEDCSVVSMKRCDWEQFLKSGNTKTEFDLADLPISAITQKAEIHKVYVENISTSNSRIKISRLDENDYPYTINNDEYEVWTDINKLPNLKTIIERASTANDQNFQEFCEENVVLVKQKPGPDHWEIPTVEIVKST